MIWTEYNLEQEESGRKKHETPYIPSCVNLGDCHQHLQILKIRGYD